MSRKNLGKALLIAIVITIVSTLSVFAAPPPPPILIDGSTTVYPIIDIAQYQYTPTTAFTIYRTGSSHGQTSVMNDYVHVGVSSDICKNSKAYIPTSGGFTTDSYVSSGSPSPYNCDGSGGATALQNNPIALDGVGILVNASKWTCIQNSAKDYITLAELATLYSATALNIPQSWSTYFSACTGDIIPIARSTDSGTRGSFLGGIGVADATEVAAIDAYAAAYGAAYPGRMLGNQEMYSDIAANANHIGYTGLAFADDPGQPGAQAVHIKVSATPGGPAYLPTPVDIASGDYALGRALYAFNIPAAPASVTAYINWLNGVQGQRIVNNVGFIAYGSAAPNWDPNADGQANVLDLTIIGGNWQAVAPLDFQGDPIKYWISADVNADGAVNVLDLTTIGGQWQQTW